MKCFWAVTFLLIPLCLQSDDNAFEGACRAYREGDFKNALALFDSIEPKTPLVFYNMGNTVYQQGNDLEALLYWERSKKAALGSLYSACVYNIKQIRNKMGIANHKTWGDFDLTWMSYISTGVWQLFFLIMWYISVVSMIMAQRRRIRIGFTITSGMLGVLLVALWMISSETTALVISNDADLYVGPNKTFHSLEKIPYAAYISVMDTKESWYKVCYNTRTGWILMENVELI